MNFRPLVFLVLMVSCASLPGPGPQDWDLPTFQAAMGRDGTLLVDLRTPSEAASGGLPGAILVEGDRHQAYLVYCAHGVRGREAAARMRQAGFIEVHNLAGWKGTGPRPTDAGAGGSTPGWREPWNG